MSFEDTKILEFNIYQKFDKILLFVTSVYRKPTFSGVFYN